MIPIETLIMGTGMIVWLFLAVGAFVLLAAWSVTAWNAICLHGYVLFAEKAEKDAIRERKRQLAERLLKDPTP